jgi:hypothetical protein
MQESAVGAWVPHEYLSGEHLHSLHDLNLRFLNLLSDDPGLSRPAAVFAALSQAQRTAAASCPYALFDVRFEDELFWTSRLTGSRLWQVADEHRVNAASVDFVRAALFYAWHVSQLADRAPQLQLGMSATTAAAFRGTAMEQLSVLAAGETSNLAPRWQNCAAYWMALAKTAAGGNADALRRVQLYGFQLSAAARLPAD